VKIASRAAIRCWTNRRCVPSETWRFKPPGGAISRSLHGSGSGPLHPRTARRPHAVARFRRSWIGWRLAADGI